LDHKSGSPESLLGLLPDINKPPIVQPWAILGSIAEALGSSMDDLVRYNRIRNPDLILSSERLRIPNPNIVWHSLAANFR
jgi:hypothetical protein